MTNATSLASMYESARADALKGKPKEFLTFLDSTTEHLSVVELCQLADNIDSPEHQATYERLEIAAAEARAADMPGYRATHPTGGHRVLTPKEQEFADFKATRDNAVADAKVAIRRYTDFINGLYQAWAETGKVKGISERHNRRVAKVVELLDNALSELQKADTLLTEGREIIRRNADYIQIGTDLFLHLEQNPVWLSQFVKNVRLRYDAELARLGTDPVQEAADRAERKRLGQYRTDLSKAHSAFIKTDGGKGLWARYVSAMRKFEEMSPKLDRADREAAAVIERSKNELQDMLDEIYTRSAAFANLVVNRSGFPKVS